MFALAAIPGSLLIARFGVLADRDRAGLADRTLASAARAAALDIWTLYGATMLMGFGVAIFQPALPTLVRLWAPARIWLATAVSTNGMLIGGAFAPALSIPLMLPLVGGSWRLDLLAWSVPGLVAALLYLVGRAAPAGRRRGQDAAPRRWWPDWNSPQLWLLGLDARQQQRAVTSPSTRSCRTTSPAPAAASMIGATLGWLNGIAAARLLHHAGDGRSGCSAGRWPFTVFGPVTTLGLLGIVLCDGIWIVVSAAAAGLRRGRHLHRHLRRCRPVSARPTTCTAWRAACSPSATRSRSSSRSSAARCWDLTGLPWTAFLPMVLCAVGLTVFGTVLTLRAAPHRDEEASWPGSICCSPACSRSAGRSG